MADLIATTDRIDNDLHSNWRPRDPAKWPSLLKIVDLPVSRCFACEERCLVGNFDPGRSGSPLSVEMSRGRENADRVQVAKLLCLQLWPVTDSSRTLDFPRLSVDCFTRVTAIMWAGCFGRNPSYSSNDGRQQRWTTEAGIIHESDDASLIQLQPGYYMHHGSNPCESPSSQSFPSVTQIPYLSSWPLSA